MLNCDLMCAGLSNDRQEETAASRRDSNVHCWKIRRNVLSRYKRLCIHNGSSVYQVWHITDGIAHRKNTGLLVRSTTAVAFPPKVQQSRKSMYKRKVQVLFAQVGHHLARTRSYGTVGCQLTFSGCFFKGIAYTSHHGQVFPGTKFGSLRHMSLST